MPVSFSMNVKTAKKLLNQKKEIVVFIALTEQFLVHQFKKTRVVVSKQLVCKKQYLKSPKWTALPKNK